MLFLRCSCGLNAAVKPSIIQRAAKSSMTMVSKRTFTSITPLRPTLSSFRPSALTSTTSAATSSLDGSILDLMPKISSHPALNTTQIRCGPRDTFSPSHFVRKRRHGFLSRNKTRKGRATLLRRRIKKRSTLSH